MHPQCRETRDAADDQIRPRRGVRDDHHRAGRTPEFEETVAARALEPVQVVVLDGRVVEVGPAPERAGRVRIAIVTAMGPPPGGRPDRREIILVCEGGQSFSTARQIGAGEPGPALRLGDHGLALEEIVGVEGLDPGRIIVFDGEVVS